MTRWGALAAAATVLALSAAVPALAQTTGGVFGPAVDEGERAMELRTALASAEGSRPERFAVRLHYDHAFDDAFRGRLVVQGSDAEGRRGAFDFVGAELLWQLVEGEGGPWTSGVRFDARWLDEDAGAHSVGVNWTNQWDFADGWRARAIGLTTVQLGDRRRDGVFLAARTSLTRKVGGGRFGVEHFSDFGSTEALGDFDAQNHRVGPVWSAAVGGGWGYQLSALVGASDAARDQDLRVWISRDF